MTAPESWAELRNGERLQPSYPPDRAEQRPGGQRRAQGWPDTEERRTSRNRLIVEACEALVDAGRGDWPAGFFDLVDPDDVALLRDAGADMEAAIYAARRDRAVVPEL